MVFYVYFSLLRIYGYTYRRRVTAVEFMTELHKKTKRPRFLIGSPSYECIQKIGPLTMYKKQQHVHHRHDDVAMQMYVRRKCDEIKPECHYC